MRNLVVVGVVGSLVLPHSTQYAFAAEASPKGFPNVAVRIAAYGDIKEGSAMMNATEKVSQFCGKVTMCEIPVFDFILGYSGPTTPDAKKVLIVSYACEGGEAIPTVRASYTSETNILKLECRG